MIAWTTVQHVVREDYLNEDVKIELDRFDRSVDDRLLEDNFALDKPHDFYIQDEPDDASGVARETDYGDMALPETPEADDVDNDLMDKYLNTDELIFDVGTGHERKGCVVKRAKGTSGAPIGRAHANPLFDRYILYYGSTVNIKLHYGSLTVPSIVPHGVWNPGMVNRIIFPTPSSTSFGTSVCALSV